MQSESAFSLLVVLYDTFDVGLAALLVVVHLFLDAFGQLRRFYFLRAIHTFGVEGFQHEVVEFLLEVVRAFDVDLDIVVHRDLYVIKFVPCTSG